MPSIFSRRAMGHSRMCVKAESRKVCNGFLFLMRLNIQVNATIVIFAEFGVQSGQQLAKRLAVPCHQFGEKQGRDSGVTFRKIKTGAEAAALFTAGQNLSLQHKLANIFEADGDFVKGAAKFGGDFVDQLGYGKGFGNVAGEIARAGEVPDQQSKKLMRIEEGAVTIDGANAIAVTIGAESGVVFAGEHGIAQRLHVRLDRLGMRAAEKWIAGAANFVAVQYCCG